jgi:hypothetical protein
MAERPSACPCWGPAERAKIEKADAAKVAKAGKEAKAERERVKQATAERKAKEAAKPAAKKKATKPDEHQRVTEAQLAAVVKKFAVDGASKSAVIKAVRASGVSAAGKRIRAAFDQRTKTAKSKAGSKKAKGAAAKVRKQEQALGINR